MLRTFFRDITSSKYIIQNLVNQELTVKYKRSFLGFFWSVLHPLAIMIIYGTVFGNIMRFDIKDYIVFLYAGLLPWTFVSQSMEVCASSIVRSEAFIKKVYLPKVVFPFSNVLTVFINTLLSFIALFFVVLIFGAKISVLLLLLPFAFCLLFLFVLGFSLLLATAGVAFRDIPYLTNIFMTAWFYLSPILYPLDMIPDSMRGGYMFNPFYYFLQIFRHLLYYRTLPDLNTVGIACGIALVFFFLGLWVFYRNQNNFVYRL